jgi:uncharacterized iron-regulated membrane protein
LLLSGINPLSTPLPDDEVRKMTATTLAAFRHMQPTTHIRVLRLRAFAQMRQGVVLTGDSPPLQIVFNTATGKQASLTEPEYPSSGFPFGVQVHEYMKQLHSGFLFGWPGRVFNLLTGSSLLVLTVTGVVEYWLMWRRRKATGKSGLLWI